MATQLTMAMAPAQETSIPWFVSYMRLHCRGVTPTDTPTDYMPSAEAMAEFWGPRTNTGFTFKDQGIPAYEVYVRELFARVYQLPWPVTGVIPFNFARGLLVEALRVEVNWAEFAFRQTHRPQWRITIPRVLTEFRSLVNPLPPLPLVIPRANITDEFIMAASIARALDLRGGMTTKPDVDVAVANSSSQSIHIKGIFCPAAPSPRGTGALRKTDAAFVGPAVDANKGEGRRSNMADFRDSRILSPSATSRLIILRPTVIGAVQDERLRLTMARDDAQKSCYSIRSRLHEEREKLKFIERKVAEKNGSHDRAAMQLQRTRDMLHAAKFGNTSAATKERKMVKQEFLKPHEELVETWVQSVGAAHNRLQSWKFKQRRQEDRVASLMAELNAAEAVMTEKLETVDIVLAQLQAVDDVLQNL